MNPKILVHFCLGNSPKNIYHFFPMDIEELRIPQNLVHFWELPWEFKKNMICSVTYQIITTTSDGNFREGIILWRPRWRYVSRIHWFGHRLIAYLYKRLTKSLYQSYILYETQKTHSFNIAPSSI